MALLEIRGLSIAFEGIRALRDVSLSVEPGQLFALVGPNGAGKTTVFNCLSRIVRQDEGELLFHGRDISRLKKHDVGRAGIARTFQNLELFDGLSALENIMVGCHRTTDTGLWESLLYTRGARRRDQEARERAEHIIEFLELEPHRKTLVGSLPYGLRKRVEIGRALALEPELLLLDEPAAGLNAEEMEELAFWLQEIRESSGMTFLLVEHDMHFVMDLSDRIAVLDHGEVIFEGPPHEVQSDPRVIEAYLGTSGRTDAARN